MAKSTKKIGLVAATAFAIGAMIGGGVFVLTGGALATAGPAALLSFTIAGLIVLLSALSFAVIASCAKAKRPGYTYVGQMLGSPIWSFLTSWCFYLSGLIAVAFVLNAFGVYVQQFLIPHVAAVWWALAAALVLMFVNLGPASEIGKIETLLVGAKLAVLLLLIVVGIEHFDPSILHPFAPHGTGQIFISSASLFIAFLGFNVITNIAGDIDRPRQTVPRAILLSMLLVTVVYIGIVLALLAARMHSYSEASVGLAATKLIGPLGGTLVVASALVSTLSSANANILGSSEIMVRLAANKDVPTMLGHMRRGHPYISVIAGSILTCALILTGQTGIIINLANVTAIVALIIVNLAAARALASTTHAGLRLPLGIWLPALGAAFAALQFAFLPLASSLSGLMLVALGLIVYTLRTKWHLPKLHPEIVKVVDQLEGPLSRALKK